MLDEPTTGMDPVARRAVWAAVDRRRAERGATVLLVTHNVIEAETVLDRVAVLDQRPGHRLRHPGRAEGAGRGRGPASSWCGASAAPLDVPEVAALRAARRGVRAPLDAAARPGRGPRGGRRGDRRRRPSPRSTTSPWPRPSLEDVYLALGGSATTGAGEGVRRRGRGVTGRDGCERTRCGRGQAPCRAKRSSST